MHHRDALLGRDARGERLADLLDEAAVLDAVDVHLLVLAAPAPELPLDVAVVAREPAEPDGVGVEEVQLGQGRREVVAHVPARGRPELGGR